MTTPRIIVAGATTAITRRTTLRKAFLAPWSPLVRQAWLYALASAQQQTGVAVHHGIMVLNHHHLAVTPQSDNLPDFTRRFHHDLSCALNTLLIQHKFDAPRELFDGRVPHYLRLIDAEAQASHLIYQHNNCVAAGLVARPEYMPGRPLSFDHWRTGYLDVRRPGFFFSEERPETIRLYVTPPPVLFAAFGGDLNRLVHYMNELSEEGTRALRAASGREPLGARRLARLHPWSEPRSLRESGGEVVPSFRVGARGILGTQQRIRAALETRAFRQEHAEARVARRDGDRNARFPYGTYEMRVRHRARTAREPDEDAIVTRPGPTLADVAAELATGDAQARLSCHERAKLMMSSVRSALQDEAPTLVEHAVMVTDTAEERLTVDQTHNVDKRKVCKKAGRPVHVQHRAGPTLLTSTQEVVSRIVVLRDRRRGRPLGRRAADPPA